VGSCLPFLRGADAALAVGVISALCLFAAGILTDVAEVPAWLRAVPLVIAAGVVTGAGLRLQVTGFDVGDVLVTVAVVCGAAAAWRSARSESVLITGWAVTVAVVVVALGAFAGQAALAAVSAVIIGTVIGYGTWLPSAARWLRPSAVMPLGFLAAVVTLDVRPVLGTPRDAVIPVLLLGLPVLDTTLVSAARLRGRVPDPRGAGLAGRLQTLGLSSGAAAFALVALQTMLGVLALFGGRAVLPFGLTLGLGAGLLAVLLGAVFAARLEKVPRRWPAGLLLLGGGSLMAAVVLAAPAAFELYRARALANHAASEATAGIAAARRGDSTDAAIAFARAQADFSEARRRLMNPIASGGLVVPLLAPNLRAARELTRIGVDVSHAGRQLTSTADPQRLRIREGTLPLAELTRLEPDLAASAASLKRAANGLQRIERPFLIAPVDDAIGKLTNRLGRATRETRIAVEAARILPAVFGRNGPKRYFLAVQNNAEMRGDGGFIGSWGLITAVDGRLSLDHFSRIDALDPSSTPSAARTLRAPADFRARYSGFLPQNEWKNVNMSPDLPTMGPVIADLLPQSGVSTVDGVVTIDPVGLSAVLRLTGPVTVPGWPGSITADNVVDVTLRQAYAAFDNDPLRRDAFLGDVASAAWTAFSHGDLGNPARVLRELGLAVHQKHLAVWLANPNAQGLVRDGHAAEAIPSPGPDLSLVTTQNRGANKVDLYLRRRVRYSVRLTPSADRRHVDVRARLEVGLQNTAPGSGLPQEVLGGGPGISPGFGAFSGFEPGLNRSFTTIYTPFQLAGATLDGAPISLSSQRELGYWADATNIDVRPATTRTLGVDLHGRLPLGPRGRYRLNLVRHPIVAPDRVDVAVSVPTGWRLVTGPGFATSRNGQEVRYQTDLERDQVVDVGIERDPPHSIWGRLQAGR
jgi:hypothetical protein